MRQKTAEEIADQEFLKGKENQPERRNREKQISTKSPNMWENTGVTVASQRGAQGVS